MMLRQQLTALPLTLLLQPLLLKLLVQLLIVLLRQLLLHKAPPIAQCLPQQHHKLAAKPTRQAWNACSRNRCQNKIVFSSVRLRNQLFRRRACRGVFYADADRLRYTIGALDQ